ncbi:MAG: hypothetical protein WKG07_31080 [Hymenobacter sp.]
MQSLTKNLPATLALLDQRLLHPRFDAADFDRVKKQNLQLIANQVTQPVVIANNAYAKLLYGQNDIMGVPSSGTTATCGQHHARRREAVLPAELRAQRELPHRGGRRRTRPPRSANLGFLKSLGELSP